MHSNVSLNRILAMFILYTTAPILYRLASSAYFNIALLSSDFFGLLFGTLMIQEHGICSIERTYVPNLLHIGLFLFVRCFHC